MNSEQITAFLQEHWYIASVLIGAVILIGAIRNWNWLCDPTGTRDAHRHSRGYRRVVFFLLGVLLIVVSIWGFVLKLKKGDLYIYIFKNCFFFFKNLGGKSSTFPRNRDYPLSSM